MGTGGQLTPPEELGETVSSKEIGGQSTLWKERGTNDGRPVPVEIRDEETAGSPQFKRARLEESLDNEPEKMGEDDTSRISPAETLMTKNPGGPTTSTSRILDIRRYYRENVPWCQEAERVQWDECVQWDEWVTHGSVKIHSPAEAAKIRQQVPREGRLRPRFACRNENAGLLDPSSIPLPVKAKARLVIQGQHCPDNARGLVRTDAPTVHRTAVSVLLQLVSSWDGVGVSGVWMFLVRKPRVVKDPWFFEPPSRGLP